MFDGWLGCLQLGAQKRALGVLLFAVLFASAAHAQQVDETRKIKGSVVERKSGSVLKKIGGKAHKCVLVSVYQKFEIQGYQCTSSRKLPWCDVPGPNRAHCPSVCSNGGWVRKSSGEDLLRNMVINCNPLGEPAVAY